MKTLKGSNILIVEDDNALREVIGTLFEEEGAKIIGVSGGHEAFDLLEKNPFDLVISDMRMPLGSGEELLRKIKQNLSLKSLPVLIITGYADVKKTEILNLGAAAVLSKPFGFTKLLQVVEACLA